MAHINTSDHGLSSHTYKGPRAAANALIGTTHVLVICHFMFNWNWTH